MSTRCRIAKQLDENKYKSIYCHFDGYPEGVGAALMTFYKDPAKVDKLINLGDISYIAPEVDPDPNKPHSFDDPQDNVVVAYGRDRGEKNVDPVVSNSFDDLQDLCADCWAEYLYVYDLDNVWNTFDTYGNPVNESDSFFSKVKTYLKEEESDATGINIHDNINRAIYDINNSGRDITYSFVSFDDDFNYLKLRALALGNSSETLERDVQLKLDGVSYDAIYEAIDTWDSEHKSPDSFYESASKGSKFKITSNKSDDIWLTFEGNGIKGSAKVYDIPSDYGIKYSNISKLSYNGKDKCNYDRGWDVVPKDTKLLDSLCKALIDYRINNLYDVDDMTVEEIKEKNNSYNYDSEQHNFKESEKLKESEWHTWMHDDPSTTYGFKNQYGYTINQLQIDDEAKEYRVGSFTQSNDKTITRKKFYQMIEELEAAGYKKVESWSNRQGAGSNTSNIVNEADSSEEYTLVNADSDKISELEKGSAFTWEGMDTTSENLKAIVGALKKDTPIKLPVTFYTWIGKEFNDKYGLTGSNAYPEDLHFLSISLDNWSEMGNLPFWKMQVGARWLDDIVDNNARRQGSSSNEDDEEE